MAGTIIRLQTNIPLVGVAQYFDFCPTRTPGYSDQISIRGTFDGAGEGRVYLPLSVEGDFIKLGIVGARTQNGSYPILVQNPRIKILRTEQGNRKQTTVELVSSSGVIDQPVCQGTFSSTAPTEKTPGKSKEDQVDDLILTYRECLKASMALWSEAAGPDGAEKNLQCVQQAAATLFINRCQRGLITTKEEISK